MAIDLCIVIVFGVMNLKEDGISLEIIWGFYIDDNRWYVVEWSNFGWVYFGFLDLSLYLLLLFLLLNSGFVFFMLYELNIGIGVGDDNGMGIMWDVVGNFYVVES